jgi:flagellar biosynthesis/type III secretory pathway chaperone
MASASVQGATQGQSLSELFRREHALLSRLALLIEKEFDAARADRDVAEILEEKQALVAELDSATSRRLDWLEARGLPTHGEPLRTAMAELDDSGHLFKLVTRFESDAMACRDRNRQLGQFNLRRQRSLQHALRIFANQASEGESNDYTALGRTDGQSASRLLGSA